MGESSGSKGGLPTGGVGGTGPDQEWGAFDSILDGRAGSRVCLCHQTAGVGRWVAQVVRVWGAGWRPVWEEGTGATGSGLG